MITNTGRSGTALILTVLLCVLPLAASAQSAESAEHADRQEQESLGQRIERDPRSALAWIEQRLAAEPRPALAERVDLLATRAGILRDYGELAAAAEDLRTLQELVTQLDNPGLRSDIRFLAGTLAAERGALDEALEAFLEAERLLQGTRDERRVRVLNAIATTHNFRNDNDLAIRYYERALAELDPTSEPPIKTTLLINRALVIGELRGPAAGVEALEDALAHARAHDRQMAELQALANLCNLHVQAGQLNDAEADCKAALEGFETAPNARLEAGTRMSLGDLYAARGQLERASESYRALLEDIGDDSPWVAQPLLEKLADLEQARDRPAAALDALRRLMALRSDLDLRERDQLAQQLEAKFRAEQREREIEMLRLENELQQSRLAERNLWLAGIVSVLLMVSGFTVYSRRRLREREALRKQLAERNTELQRALDEISHLARVDELTGLLNRRAFIELAREESRRNRRFGTSSVIALLDLDHFKDVNDRHGHRVGDQVLVELARRLRRDLRDTDVVCRWGGEEFVLLLPVTTLRDARQRLRSLFAAFRSEPIETDAGVMTITLTCGLSDLHDELDEALEHADQAMYRGKQAGRDRIVFGDEMVDNEAGPEPPDAT
ncbi:MAG: diguanylate cyclase [Wenzhouxiangellaceae bacterium]|nr:diguanylate cyclase [Wenzhouxiangellaceae bacterium]